MEVAFDVEEGFVGALAHFTDDLMAPGFMEAVDDVDCGSGQASYPGLCRCPAGSPSARGACPGSGSFLRKWLAAAPYRCWNTSVQ